MKPYFHFILTILICNTVFFFCDSFAQENQIQTDRHDQTESPFVVPINHFQIEGYGFIPEQTQADHRLDFGMSIILLNNLSFDASAGFGITKNAPDFFVNGGVSIRIPR